jgi:RNA polymerase primary sigma factor
MTSKITVAARDEGAADGPSLDLIHVAVTELVRNANKRGYVTEDQISALQLVEGVKPEQIEDIR